MIYLSLLLGATLIVLVLQLCIHRLLFRKPRGENPNPSFTILSSLCAYATASVGLGFALAYEDGAFESATFILFALPTLIVAVVTYLRALVARTRLPRAK